MRVLTIIGALVVAAPFLAIASLALTSRLGDINDAPCLVCREHQCVCGES